MKKFYLVRNLPKVLLSLLIMVACVACQSAQPIGRGGADSPVAGENPAPAENDDSDEDIEPDTLEPELVENDPLEGFNRKIHSFNDFFFHYGIYPVAKGWNFITPNFVREGFNNFFRWAYTPGRLINNLLQGKLKGAARETAWFAINGTMGVFGLYDASKDVFSMAETNEDTDQTLGKWGIPEGAYVVWPFIGPYTVRGTFGFAGDVMLQPQTVIVPVYVQPETIWTQAAIVAGTYSARAVNRTSLNPEEYDDLIKDSIDPYIFIRDIYLQNTRKNVAD